MGDHVRYKLWRTCPKSKFLVAVYVAEYCDASLQETLQAGQAAAQEDRPCVEGAPEVAREGPSLPEGVGSLRPLAQPAAEVPSDGM